MKNIKVEFNERQLQAWNNLSDDKTEVILYGGSANSGKSWLAGTWLLLSALAYPGTRWAMCRKNLNDLKKTTLKTFLDVCKTYDVKKDVDFNINFQSNTINFRNGSEIYLVNLEWRPSDIDGDFLGGYELSGAVIDEVPQITKEYFEVLYSRIRYRLDEYNLSKKLLCTCNPSNGWAKTFFYDRYINNTLPSEIKFINTVGGFNPFRGKDYEKRLSMLSESQLKRLEYGDWEYASSVDQLFTIDKIQDILTHNQHGNRGDYYISADIARFGEDSSVIIVWEGMTVIRVIKLEKSDTMNTANEIVKIMNELKIPRNKVIVDSDGVGGGVMDKLKSKGFINNAKPFKSEKYDMLKTQCYFKLKDERWSISDNVDPKYKEQIRKELEAIRDNSDEFKYKINSKDEQKKLLGNKSPDFSDSLMMRMYFTFVNNTVIIDFGGR